MLTPAGQRTTSVWDYENKLVGVLNPSGTRETMAYDPDGKRVKHQTATDTAKYVWDDQNYLAETNASDVTQATYTNEPRTYGNLISQRRSGATHYYVFDALGSTRLLTDSAEAVSESLLYDAWGNLITAAPTLAVPFRWVGELGYLFVPSTADYYVRARVYRPAIGRWSSKDPLGITDSLNYYKTVGNRIYILTDPNGCQPWGGILGYDSPPRPGPRGRIGSIIGTLIRDYLVDQWQREHPNYWIGFAEAVGFPPTVCGSLELHPIQITIFGPVETDSVFQVLILPEFNIDDAILSFVQDYVEPQFESLESKTSWDCPQGKKCCELARITIDVDVTARVHTVYPALGGDLNSVVSVRVELSHISRFGICVDTGCPCPNLFFDRSVRIDADLRLWPPIPLEDLVSN